MRLQRAWAVALFVGLFVPHLIAQTDLKVGAEPCDQALRHASSSVMSYLEELNAESSAASTKQAQSDLHYAADYRERIALATEVIMHCETPGVSAADLQDDLILIYRLRPSGATRTAPQPTVSILKPDGNPLSDMEISVEAPANDPKTRAIVIVFGHQNDRATLRLLFMPSKKMVTVIASDGREISTSFPDGFVRILP